MIKLFKILYKDGTKEEITYVESYSSGQWGMQFNCKYKTVIIPLSDIKRIEHDIDENVTPK